MRNEVAAGVVCLCLVGCRAYGPSTARMVEVAKESGVAAFAVGVRGPQNPNDSQWARREHQVETDRLVRSLRESQLFRRVDYAANVQDADAAFVTLEPVNRTCFSEPLFTVLTLGLIPNVTCYRSGFLLSFSRCGQQVRADSTAEGTLVIGWVAPLIAALPGWSWRYPERAEAEALELAAQGAFDELSDACSQDD